MNEFGSYEHIQTEKNFDNSKPYSYNVSCFEGKNSSDWLYAPRWHEQFELKLILSGNAEVFCGTEMYVAGPGDVVLINPYEVHGLRLHGEKELRYYCLMLSPDFPFCPSLAARYSDLFEGKYFFCRVLSNCTEVNLAFNCLFTELIEHSRECELQAEAYIALLYSLLLRHSVAESAAPSEASQLKQHGERIRPALNYIYFHYTEEIFIPKLAELCCMSVYHFCRIFKSVVGHTAVSYINTLRLNKATLLLTNTKLSVSEIASAVGFPDELYFSRRFKQEKNISPTKYRANART